MSGLRTAIEAFKASKYDVDSLDAATALDSRNIGDTELDDEIDLRGGKDGTWVGSAFIVEDPDDSINSFFTVNKYLTSADVKFTDSSLGGNLVINPRPQFTRYSDIRKPGRLGVIDANGNLLGRNRVTVPRATNNIGMGSYYSSAIDDNKQMIQLTMGVPQFRSLTGFFSNAIDPNMASLANTGKTRSAFYNISKSIVSAVIVLAFCGAFPLAAAAYYSTRALLAFVDRGGSRYYSLQPEMFMYWAAVNALVSNFAINLGILPRYLDTMDERRNVKAGTIQMSKDDLDALSALMPGTFTSTYGLDVYYMCNKSQALYNKAHERLQEQSENSNSNLLGVYKLAGAGAISPNDFTNPGLLERIGTFMKKHNVIDNDAESKGEGNSGAVEFNSMNKAEVAKEGLTEKLRKVDWDSPKYDRDFGDGEKSPYKDADTWHSDKAGFVEMLKAQYADGGAYLALAVDYTGTVTDTMSNTAGESELGSKFNSIAATGREMKFSFAGGNITDNKAMNAIQGVGEAVVDTVMGAVDAITGNLSAGVRNALFGGGFIDFPKQWQSSSVDIAKSTYTMTLISPDAQPISLLQNIYIPLACIMAATLPLSTGRQGYTSPFLIQMFDRGRSQVKMGMISNFTVNRGTSNLGFTTEGVPLCMELSFSFMDFSSVMHMPISSGSVFASKNAMLDEDTILYDYLASLTGLSLRDQAYAIPRAKLKIAKWLRHLEQYTYPSRMAMWTKDFSVDTLKVGKIMQALSASSGITYGDGKLNATDL